MIKTPKSALLAALLLSACAVHAQETPPTEPPPPEPPSGEREGPRPHFPPPLLVALDTDKNRTISATELAASATSLLTLDANKDGTITMDELRPPRKGPDGDDADAPDKPDRPKRDRERPGKGERGPDGHRPPPPMPLWKALDLNADRKLSPEEITKAPVSLKTLDKNNDGELTKEELRPEPPPRRDGPDDEPES